MDISVAHLNSRMALQVPPELPLGLVFITGRVVRLRAISGRPELISFTLTDGQHRLRCRLPIRVAQETLLRNGDRVRAGGHLAFDPREVQYVLIARDLEVLPRRSPETSLRPILESAGKGVENEEIEGAATGQSDLPGWVQKLAPPEVRRELGLDQDQKEGPDSQSGGAPAEPSGQEERAGAAPSMPDELLNFLSSAMDSDDDVELTAAMVAAYLSDRAPSMGAGSNGPQAQPSPYDAFEEWLSTPQEPPQELPADPNPGTPADNPSSSSIRIGAIVLLGLLILGVITLAVLLQG